MVFLKNRPPNVVDSMFVVSLVFLFDAKPEEKDDERKKID